MEILAIRLTDWAETNNVLDESQAGFRKGYSTMDNIFSLLQCRMAGITESAMVAYTHKYADV